MKIRLSFQTPSISASVFFFLVNEERRSEVKPNSLNKKQCYSFSKNNFDKAPKTNKQINNYHIDVHSRLQRNGHLTKGPNGERISGQ